MGILAIMAGILGVSDSGHNHGRLQVLRHDPEAAGTGFVTCFEQHQHAAVSRCRWSVRRGPAAVGAIFAAFRRAPGPRAEIGAGVLRERRAKINRVIDAAQNERIDDSGSVKMTAVSVK
jgi:hypothetical protein